MRPRTIEIAGRRYAWSELVALRKAQAVPKAEQPALFEMRDDRRPPGERTPKERHQAPSLFTYGKDNPCSPHSS